MPGNGKDHHCVDGCQIVVARMDIDEAASSVVRSVRKFFEAD